jgi:hypothetical protein
MARIKAICADWNRLVDYGLFDQGRMNLRLMIAVMGISPVSKRAIVVGSGVS